MHNPQPPRKSRGNIADAKSHARCLQRLAGLYDADRGVK